MQRITVGALVRDQLTSMLPAFDLSDHHELIEKVFDSITRESLALDISAPLPRFSVINSDGMPFEFSVSAGSNNGGLRILAETGVPGTSLPERINLTCIRIAELLRFTGMTAASGQVNAALRILFPSSPEGLKDWRGGAWIAAAFLPGGKLALRLYINGADGNIRQRWSNTAKLLAVSGRNTAARRMDEYYLLFKDYALPLGTALDITPDGIGRIKFYARSFAGTMTLVGKALDKSGLSASRHLWNEFSSHMLVEQLSFPDSSLVVSLEFPRGDSDIEDLKIDACAHCLFHDDQGAMRSIRSLGETWGIDLQTYENMVSAVTGSIVSAQSLDHHSFIGMGINHQGEVRLNIYLKPSLKVFRRDAPYHRQPHRITLPDTGRHGAVVSLKSSTMLPELGERLTAAASFIETAQAPAGYWLDFMLPVGVSDAWVTAYTGLAMSSLPGHLVNDKMRGALGKALMWLMKAMQPDAGWGYNAFTGSDADSTAYAILFLQRGGVTLPDGSCRLLSSFQREDGGFATYLKEEESHSWGHSHADVTPIVTEALLACGAITRKHLAATRRYLLSQQESSGLWHSFWWRSSLYSTWVNLRLASREQWRFRRQECLHALSTESIPDDPFSLALLAGCLTTLVGYSVTEMPLLKAILARLFSLQSPEGCWVGEGILRLTSPTSSEPWREAGSGDYYPDICHIFTTSTVLSILSSLETLMIAGNGSEHRTTLAESQPRKGGVIINK